MAEQIADHQHGVQFGEDLNGVDEPMQFTEGLRLLLKLAQAQGQRRGGFGRDQGHGFGFGFERHAGTPQRYWTGLTKLINWVEHDNPGTKWKFHSARLDVLRAFTSWR
jgi:hypothetical protein